MKKFDCWLQLGERSFTMTLRTNIVVLNEGRLFNRSESLQRVDISNNRLCGEVRSSRSWKALVAVSSSQPLTVEMLQKLNAKISPDSCCISIFLNRKRLAVVNGFRELNQLSESLRQEKSVFYGMNQ